jgi:hypothetical protein
MKLHRAKTLLTATKAERDHLLFANRCAQCPEACRIDELARLRDGEKMHRYHVVRKGTHGLTKTIKQLVGITARVYRWHPTKKRLCPDENDQLLCKTVREFLNQKEYDTGIKITAESHLDAWPGKRQGYEGASNDNTAINTPLDQLAYHTHYKHGKEYISSADLLARFDRDYLTLIFEAFYRGRRSTLQWLHAQDLIDHLKDEIHLMMARCEDKLINTVLRATFQAKDIKDGWKRMSLQLTLKQIQLFTLRYIKGWAPTKIARVTGTSKQNVSKEILKAKRKISTLMGWDPSPPQDMERLRRQGYTVLYLPDDKPVQQVTNQIIMTSGTSARAIKRWSQRPGILKAAVKQNPKLWRGRIKDENCRFPGLLISEIGQEELETFIPPEHDYLFWPWLDALYTWSRRWMRGLFPRHPRSSYAYTEAKKELALVVSEEDRRELWTRLAGLCLPRCYHSENIVVKPTFGDGKINYRFNGRLTCQYSPGSEVCLGCAPRSEFYEHFRVDNTLKNPRVDRRYDNLDRWGSWSPRCTEMVNPPKKAPVHPAMRPRVVLLRRLLKIFLLFSKK